MSTEYLLQLEVTLCWCILCGSLMGTELLSAWTFQPCAWQRQEQRHPIYWVAEPP